jgi:CRP-like cAMP-binding protein
MAADPTRPRITNELLFTAFAGPSAETEDPGRLERLASAVIEENVKPGHVLFREGDEASNVHFMSAGRMRLTREGRPDWVYEGRWVVGTTDVLLGRPRARTAVMETEARLFRLPAAHWFEAVEGRPTVLLTVLVGFARGIAGLYVRLAPDGGFPAPEVGRGLETDSLAARARILAQTPLLMGVPMQALIELANIAELRTLQPNEEVFASGQRSGRVFVVTRGRIEARRADPDVCGEFGPGSIVGSAVCLGDPERAWGARALDSAEVLSFSVEDLFDAVEEHQLGVRAMMGTFAGERDRACEVLADRLGELVLR